MYLVMDVYLVALANPPVRLELSARAMANMRSTLMSASSAVPALTVARLTLSVCKLKVNNYIRTKDLACEIPRLRRVALAT